MRLEKSCGALVYRRNREQIELLLIKNRYGGHWSFPKGHVEGRETEVQTALREVKEETGLDISLQSGFRQVVYFLGEATSNDLHMQEEEISRIIWMDIHKAYHMVTFKNDKNLIWMAGKRLQ